MAFLKDTLNQRHKKSQRSRTLALLFSLNEHINQSIKEGDDYLMSNEKLYGAGESGQPYILRKHEYLQKYDECKEPTGEEQCLSRAISSK